MDFRHSERSLALQDAGARLPRRRTSIPAEHTFEAQAAENRAAGTPFRTPEVLPD